MTRELDQAWFLKNAPRRFRTRWPTADEMEACENPHTANGPLMTIVRAGDFQTVTCSLPSPSRNCDKYLKFLFGLPAPSARRKDVGSAG
jgi:hypothetical protein